MSTKIKDSTKNIIKAIAIVVAFVLIISSIFIIRSCSAPPEYEEIRARVEELIEKSYDVNDIVWGKGFPTYERVMKPIWSFYESGKTYLDEKGEEQPLNYYYYYIEQDEAEIVAYRNASTSSNGEQFKYALISSQPMDKEALKSRYPDSLGVTPVNDYYAELCADAEAKIYAYLIPYTEPTYDFYYLATDAEDYDYVIDGTENASVDGIKALVRTVYAEEYADSLDAILFDGVAEGSLVSKARYSMIQTSRGTLFASRNTFEPLFTERRVYLYESAHIDRANSNNTSVVVELDSYLPSAPDKIETTKVSFVLQDGVWYLSVPTY